MKEHVERMLKKERDHLKLQRKCGCSVRSLARKIQTREQLQNAYNWDIVVYLQEFASPRFKDRNELTGRVKLAMGRHNKMKLLEFVDRVNQIWMEAFDHFYIPMRDPQKAEDIDNEEKDEWVDEGDFIQEIVNQCAALELSIAVEKEKEKEKEKDGAAEEYEGQVYETLRWKGLRERSESASGSGLEREA